MSADAGGGGRPAGGAALKGFGYNDVDFMALLEFEARGSSLELEPENVPVTDGLRDDAKDHIAASGHPA